MKWIFLMAVLMVCTHCKADSESEKIEETVTRFYGWYVENSHVLSKQDFLGEQKANQNKLRLYLEHFRNSGFVGNEYIENEFQYYTTNHQTESHHCFCGSEIPASLELGPLETEIIGNRATVIVPLELQKQTVTCYLKKENKQWYIIGFECIGDDLPPLHTDTGANNDEQEIADVLHRLFKYLLDEKDTYIDFAPLVNDQYTFDETLLRNYLQQFKDAGFVTSGLIEDEVQYYKDCSQYWEEDARNEYPPTGLTTDNFFCSQDLSIPYHTAPVFVEFDDDGVSAIAILKLLVPDEMLSPDPKEQIWDGLYYYGMKKENGRWLLNKSYCGREIPKLKKSY